jgi:hypothetical protein
MTHFKVHIGTDRKHDKGQHSKPQCGVSNLALLNMKSKYQLLDHKVLKGRWLYCTLIKK